MALQISYDDKKLKHNFPAAYCVVVGTSANKNLAPTGEADSTSMVIEVAIFPDSAARNDLGRTLAIERFEYPYQAIDSGYNAYELAYATLKAQEALFASAVDLIEE